MENKEKQEEEPIEFKEYTVSREMSTEHDHEYTLDPIQDKNTNLTSVFCSGCSHGVMVDFELFELKGGKIVKR